MKKDLLTLAFLVLVAFVGATIVFIVSERSRQDKEGTPIAQIPATGSPAPGPLSTDTPVPALEPQPTATQTPTPESTATPTPCAPPEAWVLYTVRPGDTLYSIAAWFGMTAEEIQLANCLTAANELRTGQTIYVPWLVTPSPTPCVPPADWVLYTVQPGENLFRIAARYGMSTERLQRANCLASTALRAGQSIRVPYLIPTPVPPPIPSNTPVIPEGLLDEIYFNPGGGPEEPECGDPDPAGEPLQITISDRVQDDFEMCVYGFTMGEVITVRLFAPDGYSVDSQPLSVDSLLDGWTVVKIDLWMPVGVPAGPWSAIAGSDGDEVQRSLVISGLEESAISTMPPGEINPFEPHRCDSYQYPEQVIVRGASFGPNQNLPLGLYLWTPDVKTDDRGWWILPLVRTVRAFTDKQGDFSATVSINRTDPTGAYWVIPVTDLEAVDYKVIDARNDCFTVP